MPLPRPRVEFEEIPFWTGGSQGELLITRCDTCDYWLHPPSPLCPRCLSWTVSPHPVSGRGVVHTFTVNRHQWLPDVPPPYVVAIVSLVEQDDLRIVARILDADPTEIFIGQDVQVRFTDMGDYWLPYFVPTEAVA